MLQPTSHTMMAMKSLITAVLKFWLYESLWRLCGIRATGSTSRSSLTVFCFYYLVGISRQLLQQVIGSRMGIDA